MPKTLTEVTHTNEVNLAKARWVQMMNRHLGDVPEHRRTIAEERLNKLISRSYQEGEKEERITVLVCRTNTPARRPRLSLTVPSLPQHADNWIG